LFDFTQEAEAKAAAEEEAQQARIRKTREAMVAANEEMKRDKSAHSLNRIRLACSQVHDRLSFLPLNTVARAAAQKREDDEFRAAMMQKFQEDARIEQMSAERRRRALIEYRQEIDKMLEVRALFAAVEAYLLLQRVFVRMSSDSRLQFLYQHNSLQTIDNLPRSDLPRLPEALRTSTVVSVLSVLGFSGASRAIPGRCGGRAGGGAQERGRGGSQTGHHRARASEAVARARGRARGLEQRDHS